MVKEIHINDMRLYAYDYQEENIINELTGNQLHKISFRVDIIGNHNQEVLSATLDNTFEIRISESVKFKAKKENSTWSYNGQELNNATPINYYIVVVELDKDLPEDHNALVTMGSTVIMNWIRTRAISELLVEKGIITNQEYEDKINKLADRDFDNLKNFISYGIKEPDKKKE